MSKLLLLSAAGNPKRRSKKRRSAAQRAATAKMLAANKSRGGGRKRRRSSGGVARRARSSYRRARRGFSRSIGRMPTIGSAITLAKNGAIGGVGALGVDVLMGYGATVLPASVVSRVNSDGSMNWLYYGVKTALAVVVGTLGGRVIGQATAARMAEGALTVMSYEIMRSLMPQSIPVGYMNPGLVARRSGSMNKIVPLRAGGGMQRILPNSNPRAFMGTNAYTTSNAAQPASTRFR